MTNPTNPTLCPTCGQPAARYTSDELGEVAVCVPCGSVWVDRKQLAELREERAVTVAEVCDAYGLGKSTVYRAIWRGWIPARQSGGGWLLDKRDVVERWGPWQGGH